MAGSVPRGDGNRLIQAVILAGGRSRRMGQDKLAMPFGPGTLLEWVVARVSAIFPDVLLVGDHPVEGVRTLADPQQGPLVALSVALAACRQPRVFVCGGDMPFLVGSLIQRMSTMKGEAIVPRLDRPQPLHAFYSIDIRNRLDTLVANGERRLGALLDVVAVRWVALEDQAAHLSCRSVNTAEEYAEARRLLRA